eukprot:498409-Rhodomonas_salina.2
MCCSLEGRGDVLLCGRCPRRCSWAGCSVYLRVLTARLLAVACRSACSPRTASPRSSTPSSQVRAGCRSARRAAEALVKAFLRRWLLHPPPPEIATHLRAALEQVALLEPSAVLPSFRVLSAAKIARFVTAGEANIAVLSDVHAALQAAQGTLEDEKLGAMAEGLLRATRFETGVGKCDAESVAKVAAAVTADIEATIVLQDE